MKSNAIFMFLICLCLGHSSVFSQSGESPLRIFGYFQNQFKEQGSPRQDREINTFLVQQLNLFFQKNLSKNWAAFVNFEFLNSFSISRNTGAMSLEEAWVRYRLNRKFNLKLGLQIPTFNHLNRIKNRTPVLPYIIRPLVYEASLSEVLPVDEFIPARAFVEVYGILPARGVKFDYAVFFGNSPNISTLDDPGQSGVDTTATFLIGGRFGIRYKELKVGVSSTLDKVNGFQDFASRFPAEFSDLEEIPRLRLGADLSYTFGPLWFQGEYIRLQYDEGTQLFRLDKEFLYATLGWRITEKLQVYGGFWLTRVHDNRLFGADPVVEIEEFVDTTKSPTVGTAYHLNDRIVFKGQFVHFDRLRNNPRVPPNPGFEIYTLAVSVSF